MENKKAIDALNSLITINNDRIEGYENASEVTEEKDLKTLFAKFIATSQKCKQELIREVETMGGEIADGTKVTGKFFRAWMDVKAAITGKDRKAILNSCDNGDDKAIETYNDVIEDETEHLNTEQKNMIIAHKSLIKSDQDHVKSLRDALVDA
ncbi:PA2169 family four-helix-bundle protein [Marivirga salinae]|uniref:PA2169 family four-helix-bundle protein n=1 Tax=Marivirga salinarum TaxID=3059078 RepID=A0AA49JB96_9BACT|nr:PA2169 family four-helix-bundle protein [Marivirga sp. BDSF4-3]WKK74736.2 PA2169 family four-helix-bundle protein [Marivirga sp. BDSF4-3]